MKKISLKDLDLTGVEQLSREQLKNVLGGSDGGSGGSDGKCTVNCPSGLYSCTSDTGDCSAKRHNDEPAGQVISISCDGTSYDC